MYLVAKYPVQKCVFYKNYVIYVTAYQGAAYTVAYDRTGLDDEQAKWYFVEQHQKNMEEMVREHRKRNQKQSKIKV